MFKKSFIRHSVFVKSQYMRPSDCGNRAFSGVKESVTVS
jgi:hypothetical protein